MYLIHFISYALMPLTNAQAAIPSKTRGLNFFLSLHHIQALHIKAVKAWMSLHLCLGFIKPSLLDNAVSTKIPCKSSYIFVAVPGHYEARCFIFLQFLDIYKDYASGFMAVVCSSMLSICRGNTVTHCKKSQFLELFGPILKG